MTQQTRSCALLLATLVSGCGGPSLEDQVAALATPRGALASSNAELVGQVNALEQAQALPLQLAESETGPVRDNGAKALSEAFSPLLHRRLGDLARQMASLDADRAERSEFLNEHEILVTKAAAAADLPYCRFEVGHALGFFGSMRYLDDAALAVDLLLARSQEAAAKSDQTQALRDLLRALRICHALAHVERVEGRVLAANLRRQTLAVADVYFAAGVFLRTEAEPLYAVLRDQLAEWPSDKRMLIGDRATVLHAYEAVRAGMLTRLLTYEERTRLAARGSLAPLESADAVAIDADEVQYLRALALLIASADRPYSERKAELTSVLAGFQQGPQLFAGLLFTSDLEPSLRRSAEDRALVEAWAVGLALAAELKSPPFRTSPVTGEPLGVDRQSDRVTVASDGVPLVTLPVLPE